ncbi:MAG: Elongation factor 2 [Candidatus Thorarchaeota archaeon]|nr:MAG: Elongation factor 2 [Candidatus Thorarchaeota archaeon]
MSHLYKKFVSERVIGLVNATNRIRNCTVIAHIDHGKTTLTDSLIAASGLLSKEVAASARLMDYDMIEQERGITIKASSISLIHDFDGEEHLIHLIDTPGHIDFSSHVTRGLRMTDGAIVVVDVIEGIMVQTETVTRQALDELVRPILFVNKVDRLITEKKLDVMKIAKEINKTVKEYNDLLGKYLSEEELEKWDISFVSGNLSIGSALDKWGFGLDILMKKAGTKRPKDLASAFIEILQEIVEIYKAGREKELAEKYPVAKVVLDSVVKKLPSPKEAQLYRVPKFWTEIADSSIYENMIECSSEGPCVVVVSNVQPDRHAGNVATVRVYSGTLRRGTPLRNIRTNQVDKSLQIGIQMVKARAALQEVPAGNLAFVTGVKGVAIGDTLVDDVKDTIQAMSVLQYPTEPVVTYTIEPKKLSELGSIADPIEEYAQTDPALEFELNPETGEMLLSGAGELHVEISMKMLERKGVEIRLGRPMVLLKEQLTQGGEPCSAGSIPHSEFTVVAAITPEGEKEFEGPVLAKNSQTDCYLIDKTNSINSASDEAEWIREGFRYLIQQGPVKGERMRRLTLNIERVRLRSEVPETSWTDVTSPFIRASRASIKTGKPQVLEPWIKMEFSSPEEYVGTLTSILAKRKGRIITIDSLRTLYRVEAELPVSESFGLANEMRTATSGWVSWGAEAGGYRALDAKYE